jgi:hypothetical protein
MGFVAVEVASTAIGFVGGLFGSNEKDAKRKAEADSLANAALNGNRNAMLKLQCLSGDTSVNDEACKTGAHPDACNGPCGYATPEAKGYAAGLVTKVKAQLAAGNVAQTVTKEVIRPALNTAGYEIIPKPDLSTLLLLGAVLVGGYLLIRSA